MVSPPVTDSLRSRTLETRTPAMPLPKSKLLTPRLRKALRLPSRAARQVRVGAAWVGRLLRPAA